MGSFNSSCLVSGQDIYYNEQIVAMIIVKNTYDKNQRWYCYPNQMYENFWLPLSGNYDDYGKIVLHKGEDKKFDILKNVLGFNNQEMHFDDFQDLCWDGEIFFDNIRGKVVTAGKKEDLMPLSITFMHRDNYLTMLSAEMEFYVKNSFQQKINLKHHQEQFNNFKTFMIENLDDMIFKKVEMMNNPFYYFFYEGGNDSAINNTMRQKLKEIFVSALKNKDQETLNIIEPAITETVSIYNSFKKYNLLLRPMMTTGQDYQPDDTVKLQKELYLNLIKRTLINDNKGESVYKNTVNSLKGLQSDIDQVIIGGAIKHSKKKKAGKI